MIPAGQAVRAALRRLTCLARRGRMERRLDDEIGFHLDMLTDRNIRLGMTPEEARRTALAAFGGRERFKDDARDELGHPGVEQFARDLRIAVRSLRRAPAFATAAVLTLALGIGANTAIFSVVNALLLRALPYTDAGRLVRVYGRATDGSAEQGPLSAGDYVDLAGRQQSFAAIAPLRLGTPVRALTGQGEPQSLVTAEVGASLFPVLGTSAQLGRTFAPGEDEAGAPRVVVLGDDLWRRVFGADSGILGRRIALDDTAHTVVGVLPRGAGVPGLQADLFLPLYLRPVLNDPARVRGRGWLGAIGRLRPGASLEQARGEVRRIGRALEREYPESNEGRGLVALELRDALVGSTRPTVLALFAASGLVLLIACANLAAAFLARLITRGRELAIRSALGASRVRIVRQLLTEAVVLSAAGGLLGLALAGAGMHVLGAAASAANFELGSPRLDPRALTFAALISLGAALLFGVAPAVIGSRASLRVSLADAGRGSTGHARQRASRVLLTVQVALAVILSVGAGLMVKSLAALYRVELGFQPARALTFQVAPSGERYAGLESHAGFLDALERQLRGLPGVTGVAIGSTLPLASHDMAGVTVEGRAANREGIEFVDVAAVSDGYFRTLGILLRRGRTFGPADAPGSPPVVVINRRMAELFWPAGDPIGGKVRLGPDPNAPWKEVVGIVGDVRQDGVAVEPQPMAYEPARQDQFSPLTVVVRTTGDPLALERAARDALRSVDPLLPLFEVRPLEELVDQDLADRRFLGLLLGLFAALALLLAAVGLYGVSAHGVSARTREFAVRFALGSSRGRVLGLVLRQALGVVLVGLILGLVGVSALAPLLRHFLFGVASVDPPVAAGAAIVLLCVTLLATLAPALRALRVEPMHALRED